MSMTPPPPLLPLSLMLPQLVLIENLVFKEKSVVLDGYRFKNCAFVNSVLIVRIGNFAIEECFFGETWWVKFEGNAKRVVRLDSTLDPNTASPVFKAVRHPNGGVSIT